MCSFFFFFQPGLPPSVNVRFFSVLSHNRPWFFSFSSSHISYLIFRFFVVFFSLSSKTYLDSLTSAAASAPAWVAVLPHLFVQRPVTQVHCWAPVLLWSFPSTVARGTVRGLSQILSLLPHMPVAPSYTERESQSPKSGLLKLSAGQRTIPPPVFINQCCCKNK